jgi:shikimate kinase
VLVGRLAPEAGAGDHRPFLGHHARAVLDEQFERRDPGYRELATFTVDADAASGPEAVVDEISAAVARRALRTRPGS